MKSLPVVEGKAHVIMSEKKEGGKEEEAKLKLRFHLQNESKNAQKRNQKSYWVLWRKQFCHEEQICKSPELDNAISQSLMTKREFQNVASL